MKKEVLSMIGHVKDTPRVLKKTYEIRDQYMTDFVNAFVEHDFKKVFFLGSGTSNHAAIIIKNIFVNLLHIEGVAVPPTYFTNHVDPNPAGVFKKEEICVICFSQHGDSISTCESAKKAREDGYFTIGVTEQLEPEALLRLCISSISWPLKSPRERESLPLKNLPSLIRMLRNWPSTLIQS